MELAGRIGWLEAQVEHLKALPAPGIAGDALQRDSGAFRAETNGTPPEMKQRAWWRFWRAW
jgi:hypothetical protein